MLGATGCGAVCIKRGGPKVDDGERAEHDTEIAGAAWPVSTHRL